MIKTTATARVLVPDFATKKYIKVDDNRDVKMNMIKFARSSLWGAGVLLLKLNKHFELASKVANERPGDAILAVPAISQLFRNEESTNGHLNSNFPTYPRICKWLNVALRATANEDEAPVEELVEEEMSLILPLISWVLFFFVIEIMASFDLSLFDDA